jgi:hypothetical protein
MGMVHKKDGPEVAVSTAAIKMSSSHSGLGDAYDPRGAWPGLV